MTHLYRTIFFLTFPTFAFSQPQPMATPGELGVTLNPPIGRTIYIEPSGHAFEDINGDGQIDKDTEDITLTIPGVRESNISGFWVLRSTIEQVGGQEDAWLNIRLYGGQWYGMNCKIENKPAGHFFIVESDDPDNQAVFSSLPNPQDGGKFMNTPLKFQLADHMKVRNVTIHESNKNALGISSGTNPTRLTTDIEVEGVTILGTASGGDNEDSFKFSFLSGVWMHGCRAVPSESRPWGWRTNGSGMDAVSCHNMLIESNYFESNRTDTKGHAIQFKTGNTNCHAVKNTCVKTGRGVNLGGGNSKGTNEFMPQPAPEDLPVPTASYCTAVRNVFIDCGSALGWQNSHHCDARENLIVRPHVTAIVIWSPEYPGIAGTENQLFDKNVVIHSLPQKDLLDFVQGMGSDTRTITNTFTYINNWWYRSDDPARSFPQEYPRRDDLDPQDPPIFAEVYGEDPGDVSNLIANWFDQGPDLLPTPVETHDGQPTPIDPPPIEPPPAGEFPDVPGYKKRITTEDGVIIRVEYIKEESQNALNGRQQRALPPNDRVCWESINRGYLCLGLVSSIGGSGMGDDDSSRGIREADPSSSGGRQPAGGS